MLQQLALNYAAGQVMWAYSILMLLSFLKDPQVVPSQAPEDFTIEAAADSIGNTSCLLVMCMEHAYVRYDV